MHTVLVGKQGKRPHGRTRHRWEDIGMDAGQNGRVWTGYVRFEVQISGWALVNILMNLQVP
jgi:hypothetical protein